MNWLNIKHGEEANMGNKGSDTKAPNFAKQYKEGLATYLKFLPKELQQELGYRQQYDPQFIEQQMGLQEKYDPRLAQEQMDALQRRDPQWLATHQGLGDKVQAGVAAGLRRPATGSGVCAVGGECRER